MMLNSSVQSTASDQLIINESVNSVQSSDAIEATMIENTDDFQPVSSVNFVNENENENVR